MACRPATPAPITNARAAVNVPAAVIIIGNIRGSASAASSTALYPAIVAMDDSASMLCARVMRGTISMEKRMAPFAATDWVRALSLNGSEKPMTT